MLKKVLLMAAVVLLGLPGLAHAQLGRGEISVGYGVAPVTDWIDAYSDKLLDVLDMKDASMDSWGGVSVNYTFRIVGGLGVGATFVYSGNNQRLAGKKISTDYYSIMPHLKMRWLNLRILSLYSRIGVGLTFTESYTGVPPKPDYRSGSCPKPPPRRGLRGGVRSVNAALPRTLRQPVVCSGSEIRRGVKSYVAAIGYLRPSAGLAAAFVPAAFAAAMLAGVCAACSQWKGSNCACGLRHDGLRAA